MANGLEKLYTYDVEGVEGELTTSQRSGVQHVAMEKQLLLRDIRGELELSSRRGPVRVFLQSSGRRQFAVEGHV